MTFDNLPDGTLLIVPGKSGDAFFWEAKWRCEGQQVKRRLGIAHVAARATPLRAEQGERTEGWRLRYSLRRGAAPEGTLTPQQAREAMREAIHAHAVDVAQEAAGTAGLTTFGALADDWLAERHHDVSDGTLKRTTLRDYVSMLRRPDAPTMPRGSARAAWLMTEWGDSLVATITLDAIDAFEQRLRSAGLKPQTRTKYLTVLSMILDHGVHRKLIATNPMASRKRKRNGRKQVATIEVYSLETVESIATIASDKDVGEMVRLAASTGLRQGELLALRWRDVRWTESAIQVRERYYPGATIDGDDDGIDTPKGNRGRTVPLSDQAAVVLERISQRGEWTAAGDLVFGVREGNPRKGRPYIWTHRDPSYVRREYVKARDKVIAASEQPMASLRFHDLRHTFGTRCATAGVPLGTLQMWMGHASVTTTMIYIHWMPQHDDAARLTRAFTTGAAAIEHAGAGVAAR